MSTESNAGSTQPRTPRLNGSLVGDNADLLGGEAVLALVTTLCTSCRRTGASKERYGSASLSGSALSIKLMDWKNSSARKASE